MLGLLAAGLIIMRVFPWFAALLSRLVGTVGPAWLVHALRQLARAPMVPGILIVLVTMATALGVMGSALSSTLERNQQERALYAAGADLRLKHSGLGKGQSVGGLVDEVEQIDGVLVAADVFRTSARVTATGFSTSGDLLAVDSDRLEGCGLGEGGFRQRCVAERTGHSVGPWAGRPRRQHPAATGRQEHVIVGAAGQWRGQGRPVVPDTGRYGTVH